MANLSLCNRADAILNLDNTCQISDTIQSLAAQLPEHVEALDQASATVRDALEVAPEWMQEKVHGPAMDLAYQARGLSATARDLANVPSTATIDDYNTLRMYAQRTQETTKNVAGMISAINCVARTFTDHSIPGMRKAAICLDDISSKMKSAISVADQIRNDWDVIVNDALTFVVNNIDGLIQKGIQSNGFTECLASLAHVPKAAVSDITGRIGLAKLNTGTLGKQLGGCSGQSRDTARQFREGAQKLAKTAEDIRTNQQVVETQVQEVREYAATITDPATRQAAQSAVETADANPHADQMVDLVAVAALAAADAMDGAADTADTAILTFTYGHEMIMDRVGNFIRIRHKDGHYTLYNATNIIHAADQTNKHLLWLENAIQKFNSHTHLYNPGPGFPAPSQPPLPKFDMTDGTSVTKAG